MAGESSRGKFVWYDLMTSDPEAAQPFYQSLVGWGTAPWEGGEAPYTMWTLNEVPLGGVMDIPEKAAAAGASPNWMAGNAPLAAVHQGGRPRRDARQGHRRRRTGPERPYGCGRRLGKWGTPTGGQPCKIRERGPIGPNRPSSFNLLFDN